MRKKELPIRKNIRLKDYDYSQNGCYFITMCVKDRHEMLGKIVGAINNRPEDTVQLSEYGLETESAIRKISSHYYGVSVDEFVIMPNHLHMILTLSKERLIIAPTRTISTVIQQLKRQISKQIGFSLWQKSYHDHIIRNEEDYQKIREYIKTNPLKWKQDIYFVSNKAKTSK